MDESVSEDIMCATHRALCEHGYAALTMQDIADESSKSKASLHYHYDTKRDLLLAFLDNLGERMTERLAAVDGETPTDEFLALLEELLSPSTERYPEFHTALLEIKAQAPYVDGFRERIADIDALVHERLRAVVAAGVEAGEFRADLDPEETATFVLTLLNGVRTRHVAVGGSPDDVEGTLLRYVEDQVVAAEAEAPVE
ncbi:TetR/AcrR family transcriptional regulator [Haloarculaceae archaeon H-GB2-1]|nr:TetR/AcrR family transcriptional regulator [Haloarculaceae archaeon H-GB1-1]MEA5385775.1 TetR/AcrR family transcriptional regulator [Haloarculaceae archaeon H-GB11]MEA5407278.1 TetR/AcrR family transcriptional regulator [Haloarculaceae archaeon H-GB2-1]